MSEECREYQPPIYNPEMVKRVWARRRQERLKRACPVAPPPIERRKDCIAPRSRKVYRRSEIDPEALKAMAPIPGTMRDIASQVAFWHGYMLRDLIGKSRFKPVVTARIDAIIAIAGKFGTRKSLGEIAKVLDLDHTTVLHHLRNKS